MLPRLAISSDQEEKIFHTFLALAADTRKRAFAFPAKALLPFGEENAA